MATHVDDGSQARSAAEKRPWLTFAIATTLLWGLWGALTGLSIQRGFPETMIYIVWSLTMIPPALVVLARTGWRLDSRPLDMLSGLAIGLLGAGGQLLLFYAVKIGPAYLIFPIISLSPVVTILLSLFLLRERTTRLGAIGIALALIALPLFDFSAEPVQNVGIGWFLLSLLVMLCWGLQAFLIKSANNRMSGESIFVYMAISAIALAPVAWWMTDANAPINWGWDGPLLAAAIQLLNAIGALTLVFAFRYGKAIVIAPLTNAGAPLITAFLSLAIAGLAPGPTKAAALALAILAAALLSFTSETNAPPPKKA